MTSNVYRLDMFLVAQLPKQTVSLVYTVQRTFILLAHISLAVKSTSSGYVIRVDLPKIPNEILFIRRILSFRACIKQLLSGTKSTGSQCSVGDFVGRQHARRLSLPTLSAFSKQAVVYSPNCYTAYCAEGTEP